MRRWSSSRQNATPSYIGSCACDISIRGPAAGGHDRSSPVSRPSNHIASMALKKHLQVALMPALSILALAQSDGSFECSNSSSAAFEATFTSLGCYNDSSVSILQAAKLSTIAMTPSFCASWCGERGYAYGGINFGTQCFCGNQPNFSNANEIDDGRCNPCQTEPESKCGATYV